MTEINLNKQAIPTVWNKPDPPKESRWFTTPYQEKVREGFGYKTNIFEGELKNREIPVVSKTLQGIYERPDPSFSTLINYRNVIPHLKTGAAILTDAITGSDIIINSDDEEAKQICDDFKNNISLHEKIKNHCNIALTSGFGLFVRVYGKDGLQNIEEFDIELIKGVMRDQYGNVKHYVIDEGYGIEKEYTDIKDTIPIIFERNGRKAFGLSFFHSLAVYRTVKNRTTKPICQGLISMDDVVLGTLENFAFPTETHVYEGADDESLREEAKKYKDRQPGDVFFVNRKHEIERREPSNFKAEPYFEWAKMTVQYGTGIPLDILSGDFSSRASSETSDSFFMRKIKSYKSYYANIIKREIFEALLLTHPSGRWNSREKVNAANITVDFETDAPEEITLDQMINLYNTNAISVEEFREFIKKLGIELFDDDKVNNQAEPEFIPSAKITNRQQEIIGSILKKGGKL